jgi:hypothetical protein
MKGTKEIVRGVARQGISIICSLLLVLFPFGVPALAQDTVPAQPPESPPPAQQFTPAQLDNLVAPIALYPDPLLSQVLVASTYPLEIVEASQWLQQNRNLQGQQLMDAARQQNWDPSIQALVAFPDVIGRLSSNVSWTTDLGNAFLAQQADVMNAVQGMRARAQAAGKLNSNAQQTVNTQTQGDQTAIDIAPADPQTIYVPQYNPEYIWGPPAWGDYPPLYYPAVGFGWGFGPGIFLGAFFGGWGGWGWGGWGGWGWGPNWFSHSIFQNGLFFNHYGFHNYYGGGLGGGGLWAHNAYHRQGVPYSNQGLANRFGGNYAGRGGAVRAGIGGQRAGALGGSGFQNRQLQGGTARSSGPQGNGAAAGGWRRFGETNSNGGQRGGTLGGSRLQSQQGQGTARSSGPQAGRAPAGGQGQWSHFNGSSSAGANRSGGFRSAPSAPSYGGSFAGRSAPALRQAPSSGGSGFRSAPSNGGGRSYGGSQPSFRGGAGSGSFGGGHASGSGGGGSHSSGGGGFHSGGGGSHSSGGGSHGGGGGGSHGGHR